MPLILYHFAPSAPSRGALLVIRNLDIDVEVKEVNLFAKEQLSPEFIRINPQHTVPTIDDNGFHLWESRAIASYLVESNPSYGKWYPTDPKKRALINQRLYFDAGTLYPRIRAICFPVLFLGETKISADKRGQLNEAFAFMEIFLNGSTWFCGDSPTIADLAIYASLSSIVAVGANMRDYPSIHRWYELCKKEFKGVEENDKGAEMFGNAVKSKLTERL